MSTKTTRSDLANLGWPIQDVFRRANAQRGGTMSSKNDVSLNDGVAADYEWWCYNVIKGNPKVVGTIPKTVKDEKVVWSYDNTGSLHDFSTTWTESWTESESASLSITQRASISLGVNITIYDIGSSSISLEIGTEQTRSIQKTIDHQLSVEMPLVVYGGEKLVVERIITTETQVVDYELKYGLNDGGLLGTKGEKWEDHYYWGFYVNNLLGTPTGQMHLTGSSKVTSYQYKITRTGPEGEKEEPISRPFRKSAIHEIDGVKTEIPYSIHGPE